jgi:purine-binding chemotaxis protein CheW
MEHDMQIVACKLEDEEYAIDIRAVQEIIRMLEITRVPHAPDFLEGVVNLRGMVIPVMDLRRHFGLPPRQNTDSTRIIIVNRGETMVGFVVDGVSEVLRLPRQAIEPPPSLEQKNATYFTGVGKIGSRLLILLNLDKILGDAVGPEN